MKGVDFVCSRLAATRDSTTPTWIRDTYGDTRALYNHKLKARPSRCAHAAWKNCKNPKRSSDVLSDAYPS